MGILLATNFDAAGRARWLELLRAALPGETIVDARGAGDADTIDIAIVANPLPGALLGLPKLRLIQSLWAGVERLLADRDIPAGVPLARMVDPAMNEAMADLFDQTDILLCATNPFEPYVAEGPMPAIVGERRVGRQNNGALTIPGNISGYPAVSIPYGLTSSGLPVGLQAYARRHDDALLLDLALVLEREHPWPLVAPGAPI